MFLKFWEYLNIPRTWAECLTTLQQMNFLAKWIGETEEEVENNTNDIEALESVVAGIVSPTAEQLVPTDSGTEGQVLTRVTGGNIREWRNVPKELPQNGTVGQVLKKTATGTEWADESGGGGSSLPSGGTTGQILAKNSDVSGDAGWIDNMPQISDEDDHIEILNGYITEVHDYIDNSNVLYRNFQWDAENKNLTFEIYNESESNTIDTGYVDGLRIGWLNAYRIYDEIEQEYEPILITVTGGLTNAVVYAIRNRYEWYWSFALEGNIIGTVAPLSYVTVTVHIEGLQSLVLPMKNLIIKPSLPYSDGAEGIVATENGKDYYIRNAREVPQGGNEGDVLVKVNSYYDGGYAWQTPSGVSYPLTAWDGESYKEPVGIYKISRNNSYHQLVMTGIGRMTNPDTGIDTYTLTYLNTGNAITQANPLTDIFRLKLSGEYNGYNYSNVSSAIKDIRTLLGKYMEFTVYIDDLAQDATIQLSFDCDNLNIPIPYRDNSDYFVEYEMGKNTGIVPLLNFSNNKYELYNKSYTYNYGQDLKVVSAELDNDNRKMIVVLKNTTDHTFDASTTINLEFNGYLELTNTTPSGDSLSVDYDGILTIFHSSSNPIQAGDTVTISADYNGYMYQINKWYYVNIENVSASM